MIRLARVSLGNTLLESFEHGLLLVSDLLLPLLLLARLCITKILRVPGLEVMAGKITKFGTKNCCAERKSYIDNFLVSSNLKTFFSLASISCVSFLVGLVACNPQVLLYLMTPPCVSVVFSFACSLHQPLVGTGLVPGWHALSCTIIPNEAVSSSVKQREDVWQVFEQFYALKVSDTWISVGYLCRHWCHRKVLYVTTYK